MSTDPIETELAVSLGGDRVYPRVQWQVEDSEDVRGESLGRARAWVRPRTTAEVAKSVEIARRAGIPLVTAGRRTAYWGPLDFDAAIVLETSALDTIAPFDLDTRVIWCGAGASVRAIDDALRTRAFVLSAHPDASGGTSIGSMVATGFSSGIGMGSSDAGTLVAGLEVVLGTGEVVHMGAATSLGAPPFTRLGIPDPTGLFLAAEGALGVVTRVAVRARAQAHRGQLSFRCDSFAPVVAVAQALRIPHLYETFRAVTSGAVEPAGQSIEVDITLRSPISRAELEGRIAWVREVVAYHLAGTTVAVEYEAPGELRIPRFFGEAGEAWTRTRQAQFAPLDLNVGYADVRRTMDTCDAVVRDHGELPWLDRRQALYFAPDFVNVGFHGSLHPGPQSREMARRFVDAGVAALSALPIVPYRTGRVWRDATRARLDPGYARLMDRIRDACDPDGILNPGVSVFGAQPSQSGGL